jgi:hypothetical protein
MNNISDEDLLYELFAHRIQFMEYSTDEYFIIKKLKLKLIETGYQLDNLNNIIYSFYSYFNILITMSEIENVNINQINIEAQLVPNLDTNILQQLFTSNIEIINNNDNQDNDPEYADMPPLTEVNNQFNIEGLFNIILGAPPATTFVFEQILVQLPNNDRTFMEDILVTTDENTLNTLNVLKIKKDMNEKCMICIEDINEDEEYFDIKCKHIFHKACLEIYLKNYNHICPVCRNEVGESFPHMN